MSLISKNIIPQRFLKTCQVLKKNETESGNKLIKMPKLLLQKKKKMTITTQNQQKLNDFCIKHNVKQLYLFG
jgi:hypothetical protein